LVTIPVLSQNEITSAKSAAANSTAGSAVFVLTRDDVALPLLSYGVDALLVGAPSLVAEDVAVAGLAGGAALPGPRRRRRVAAEGRQPQVLLAFWEGETDTRIS
jgi:hypothetical protein